MTRKWKDKSAIEAARQAEDGTENSFIRKLDSGGETLCHKRHLHLNTAVLLPAIKKVKFNLPTDKKSTVANKSGVVTRSRA